MPYDIRKRNCKQADGKKGKYVVVKKKSKGRTEQESCHTSEKKAKGAVRARYASEANEGETVKITLEELRQLIREAMAEVTRPLPVYEKEEGDLEEEDFGASDDPMTEISDDAKADIAARLDQDEQDSEEASAERDELRSALGIESKQGLDTLTEAVMVALQPMIKPVHQEMTQDDFWMKVAGIKAESLNEGEVVDMFSGDQKKQNVIEKIARAFAARASEMLDADGDGDDIAVHVDHKLFLSPYLDFQGHGGEVQALADFAYSHTQEEGLVDKDLGEDPLDYILSRIDTGSYDEDIEYALEALGDDRFTMPHTYKEDEMDKLAQFPDERGDPYSDDYDEDPSDDDLDRMFSMFLDRKEEEMEAVRSSDNVIPLRPEED